ncbi:type II toxin-antitoxin system VapB family antitoxin [Paraburkholderia sp. J7]|uniref:type II toxin-antitoxin system VapB family antitoxin n=1 Tax=Paraburkholderia sp. J7 TaxID=2805438 RepID=UPI002AB7E0E7|nr:type II toxin-antitoxin system VapB family antitoxin [Paraburkholderia sp. J7]
MRTTLEIDDRLMADALAAAGPKTERDVVELGLRTIIRLKRQEEIIGYRGKLDWQGNLDEMRRD